MKKKKFQNIARNVIEREIKSLKKLKKGINSSFDKVVEMILKCKNGKVIISGTGKSGIIANKISSTLASVGTPSFYVDAGSFSHGDLGKISSNDVLILISNSGNTEELKTIIQYASRNKKIKLIGIMSKKDSLLYKYSDLKLLLPNVTEADPNNIVPTSSTTTQLALGDAIAVSTMQYKRFGNLDFKRFHPGGHLGKKLKTVGDLMLTGNKIPFVKENLLMKEALNIISKKKLGVLISRNNKKLTNGIITDGDIKRATQKKESIKILEVKDVMKKNPISVYINLLASEALSIMHTNKITSLCVHKNKKKNKTVGIIHIHNILDANIQ